MPGLHDTQSAPDLPPGPRFALVVATTTYDDTRLRQLRAPAQDAKNLAKVLGDPAIGGFSVASVVDQSAQTIRTSVEDFLSDRSTQDLVLVYLSCHGLLDAYRRLFFAATDTRKDRLRSTGIEAAWILDVLEHCRARRQILILDSCFSGAFAHGAKGDADVGLRDRFAGHGRGRVVLTASTATEYSFEGEPTDEAAMTASVFTAALVEGLHTGKADIDLDGYISVDDAYSYAFDRVQAAGAAQTPQRWFYGAEGKIVLARSAAGRPVRRGPPAGRARASTATGPAGFSVKRQVPAAASHHDPGMPGRLALTVTSPEIEEISTVAFSPDGLLLACGCKLAGFRYGTIWLLDSVTGQQLRSMEGLRHCASIAFSPDGRTLATSSDDATRLWDLGTGKLVRTIEVRARDAIIAFSSDGEQLIICNDQMIRLVNVANGKVQSSFKVQLPGSAPVKALKRMAGREVYVTTAALSRDGRLFAAGQNDGRAQVWDTGTGDHKHTLKHEGAGNHTERIEVVALSPDGDRLATANRRDARLWDLTNAGQALILNDRSSGGYTPQIRTITFAPDGRLVATGDDSGDITLWDAITGKRLHAFPDGTRKNSMRYTPVSAIAFSQNGNQLAAGTFEPHIRFNPSTVTSDSPAAWLQVWN